jgi:ligand-binding sensor domain-containing protein
MFLTPCGLPVTIDGAPVLQPFPSWEWNDPMDPSKLQYIQSMEIDSRGNMWILDVGRVRTPVSRARLLLLV